MKPNEWFSFTGYTFLLWVLIIWFVVFIFYFMQNILEKKTENFTTKNKKSEKGIGRERERERDREMIPKNIIQLWIDFDKKMDPSLDYPSHYNESVLSIRKKNPEYNYMFFNQKKIEEFLQKEYPEYYQTYKLLPVNIQRVDFFRYVAVYHYGGFYFDLDITGLEPLDELLSLECVFPIDDFISEDMCHLKRYKDYCNKNMDYLLGQYAFAAKPGHAFIKLLVDTIHKNINKYIQRYHSKDYLNHEVYVYETTGPDFVTNVYMNYMNKPNITIIEYHKRQYFGKYARHNYKGSWKKNKSN